MRTVRFGDVPSRTSTTFINHPHGHAWYIDRPKFADRLRSRAASVAVTIDVIRKLRRVREVDGETWEVDTDSGTWCARWLIDATGRSVWLSRRLAGQRIAVDRQIAVVSTCDVAVETALDPMSLVETTPFGWWYSSPTPGGSMTLLFFTDADLRSDIDAEWRTWLDHAPFTRARVSTTKPPKPTACVAASSQRSAAFGGERWLAVGEAAFSVDPISSHGLTIALKSGIDAADAIVAGSIDPYLTTLDSVLTHIREQTSAYYRMEIRWNDFPYWERRNGKSATLAIVAT